MKAQYGIYITSKDEQDEFQVELLEGPIPRVTAVKKAKELQRQEVRETGYTGTGKIPGGFRNFWAMNMKSGKIAF